MATQLSIDAGAAVRLRCWGEFAIADAASGADLRPRGRKARALLAYLAMHPDKPVSRERLTALLWSDRAEEQARSSLRQSLFELRHFGNGRGLLRVDRDSVTLRGDHLETDIQRLRDCADFDALLTDLPEADDMLFVNLEGLSAGFDEWLQIERTRQRDAMVTLIADASASAIAAGRVRAARALHARLIEFDPAQPPAPATTPDPPIAAPAPPAAPARARRMAPVLITLCVAVAGLSGAVWLRSGPQPVAARTGAEVSGLYEAARAILYQRKSEQYPVAASLLRRAVAIQPNHAPALANLASVIAMSGRTPQEKAEAERLARRAVKLQPGLAEAHGVLGMVLGFKSPEARAAIRRAAALDTRDPQIQFWLSHVLAFDGDYAGQLQALRRAVATDPLWHRASGAAALAAWSLGYEQEATAHAARLREIDIRVSFHCSYALDWARGDYSEAVRDTFANRERLNDVTSADWKLGVGLLVLGHRDEARLLLRLPPPLWRVASGAGPAPGELEPLLIEAERNERAQFYLLTAIRQVLQAGRPAEIVSAYDRRIGVLAELTGPSAAADVLVLEGLQVALALRAVGRAGEGEAMLARADAVIRKSLGYGRLPNWMHAAAAGIWAAQGRREEAITALETAIRGGWHYSPMTPEPDLAEIPSFEQLRRDPRFERLRRQELDHLARERRKLGPVLN